jgi:hypothetical protein
MKKTVLSLFIASAISGYSQTPSLQWEKSINGQLSGYDNVQCSWQDPAGNFLIAGNSNNDVFVLKVDNNGNELLRIVWNGPQNGSDMANSVRSDAAGNIYLGGLTNYNSNNVPFVTKFNSSGTEVWEYVQSSVTVNGALTAMALDNYSGPANIYFTGSKNDSSAIIKIDANTGASVWEKTLWPHGKMNDIDIDNNGHPLVCGYQAFTGVNADFYAAVLDINTGYPLRGYWQDGSAVDSVTSPSGHFDMASKIKAGPAGSFVVYGTLYNTPTAATLYMVKFGSTGNVPSWMYSYDSPTHTEGNGVRLLTDASFSNFYFLAGANSTSGSYYEYTIAGKVNNTGVATWVKEFNQPGGALSAHDMALDANGNAHIISDAGYPGDIYYKKLSSATGNVGSSLQYDNQRGGGNAYDFSSNIFLDNTGHPYVTGSSSVLSYTNLDVLLFRLNTNATLDWDITFDFFINSPNTAFNVQTLPTGYGTDQVITCGTVINNITQSDASITSYNEKGAVNWQATFDDNNGGDHVVGFEKSYSGNLFLCSFNNSNSLTTITEFYNNGTTNFSNKTTWPFEPTCFKIDSAENSFAAGSIFGSNDFTFGIYLRPGVSLNNTPATLAATQTSAAAIATDNTNIYVAGTIENASNPTIGKHSYIQKYDLSGNRIWSATIMGFDSTAYFNGPVKMVYDRSTNAVYVVGTAFSTGSTVRQSFIAKINSNGTIAWVKKENAAGTRHQYMNDLFVLNGKIYVTGYAYTISASSDHFALTEVWDLNGNKQWEYVFDKTSTTEEGASIKADNAGNVFVGGKVNGNPIANGNGDMLLLKLNAAGNLLWEKEYNGAGNGEDAGSSIALSTTNTTNPRIYMSGNTQSSGTNYDIATLKYCDLALTQVANSGSTSICQNSSVNLTATGISVGTLTWTPGSSNASSINVNASGSYYFTYTEADGCSENSDTVIIHLKSAPTAIQICMVTVDSLSTHNIIYWEKTSATPDVVGFKMYREDLTNIYTYIGSVSIDSLSEFHDYSTNPNVTTKRYKISTVDSCGNESALSNYHNTIYIVNVGGGQYIWNPLYTIENSANPVSSYVLMRDDNNTGNFIQIASTAGNQNTLTDPSYASYPNANWRVDALGFNCNPTQRLASGNNSTLAAKVKSHSNQGNNRVAGISTVAGSTMQVKVYPNPSSGSITILNSHKTDELKVTDVLGNIIYEARSPEQKTVLNIESSGVYFVTVISGKETSIQKIVISN